MQSGLTAVCADDSMIERYLIKRILEEHGITVVHMAEDGWDALEAIRHHKPDVVTLDIVMPQLSGLDVLRSIHKEGITCTVFMASSMAMMNIKNECAAMGAVHFIVKPYDELQTWNDIAKVLNAPR